MGTILAHTCYEKQTNKPKSKNRNSYYIPYHCADVVGCDAGPVPMELVKIILKCWTYRGLHYECQCSNHIGSSPGDHRQKKNINQKTLKGFRGISSFGSPIRAIEAGAGGHWAQIG